MHWRLNSDIASFEARSMRGTINLRRPELGIEICGLGPSRQSLRVLEAKFSDSSKVNLHDSYNRGLDLISLYPQTAIRPFNIQLQYRLHECVSETGLSDKVSQQLMIEQWISNFTFSLDTHPTVEVAMIDTDSVDPLQFWIADGESLVRVDNRVDHLNPSIALVSKQYTGQASAFIAMIHPLDQCDTKVSLQASSNGKAQVIAKLFGRFMEKGVIRRARLQIWVSHQVIDDNAVQNLYQSFASSELPLTT